MINSHKPVLDRRDLAQPAQDGAILQFQQCCNSDHVGTMQGALWSKAEIPVTDVQLSWAFHSQSYDWNHVSESLTTRIFWQSTCWHRSQHSLVFFFLQIATSHIWNHTQIHYSPWCREQMFCIAQRTVTLDATPHARDLEFPSHFPTPPKDLCR